MRNHFKSLSSARLEAGAGYHEPAALSPLPVGLDSPALEVMTDLRQVAAATIGSDIPINAANQAMVNRGVRSLLVVDGQANVVGVVTARDILGERPMQVVHKRGIRFGEVKVADIMTRREEVEVLDLAEVLRARVGAVVETLKRCGRQHALVVDRDIASDRQMVRGIFSVSQIARQLGIALPTTEIARSFAEIEAAILGGVAA